MQDLKIKSLQSIIDKLTKRRDIIAARLKTQEDVIALYVQMLEDVKNAR